jgi:hypothetical protein
MRSWKAKSGCLKNYTVIFREGLRKTKHNSAQTLFKRTNKQTLGKAGLAIYVWRNNQARWRNHSYRVKEISITYTECVSVAFVIQHAQRIFSAQLCIVWLFNFFSHYLINGTIFEKKLLNIKCVFWFSLKLLSETFFILRRIERDMIINVYRSSCKVPAIVVRL